MHTIKYYQFCPHQLVQLEQFANLFQDKLNCSTDTLAEVWSTFGKNRSQKMLLPGVVRLARLFLVVLLQMLLVKGHSQR